MPTPEQQIRNRLYALARTHNDTWNELVLHVATDRPLSTNAIRRLRGYELVDQEDRVLPGVRCLLSN